MSIGVRGDTAYSAIQHDGVDVVKIDGTGIIQGQKSEAYIYIRDEKTSGTAGGTFTAGSYVKRTLNTAVIDTGSNASVTSSVVTLQAGTYRFHARAPAFDVNSHKAKLVNTTDAITYLGTSEYASVVGTSQSSSHVTGRFTIAAAKDFELQHRCQTTRAPNGLGVDAGFGDTEVYSEIEFWKEV